MKKEKIPRRLIGKPVVIEWEDATGYGSEIMDEQGIADAGLSICWTFGVVVGVDKKSIKIVGEEIKLPDGELVYRGLTCIPRLGILKIKGLE